MPWTVGGGPGSEQVEPGRADPPCPPMVVLAAGTTGDVPIYSGRLRTLGIKSSSTREPFYFVAGGRFASRYARRFPLTAEGWELAWKEFSLADPDGARAGWQRIRDEVRVMTGRAALADEWDRLDAIPKLASIRDCQLIGGFGHDQLVLSEHYDVYFADDHLIITTAGAPTAVGHVAYRDLLALRVDGPGAVTSGGGFIGGGFGLVGAVEGMIVASLLNSLTTKTTIQTIIEVQDHGHDFIFFTGSATPEGVELWLKPVQAKLRQVHHTGPADTGRDSADPLERLEMLARLHHEGALTTDEFATAKQAILRNL